MNNNMNDMLAQMQRNPAALQSLMRSRDGQLLMQLLTRPDNGAGLQQAVQSAMKGDTSAMMNLLNGISQNPDGAALLDRVSKAAQK